MSNENERGAMSPYAPIRYRDSVWWKYAHAAAQAGQVTQDGRFSQNLPEAIMQNLCIPMARVAGTHFAGHPDGQAIVMNVMAKTMEYRHWIPLVAQYELSGRQIFDLTDELVEMLSQTDIGDCTLEGWNSPYDAFFVRFGKQEAMKVPFDDDFEYLDGAFVAVTPWDNNGGRRIKFGFSTVHKDGSGVDMPGYFLDLNPDEQAMPILEGIGASIARRIAAFSSKDGSTAGLDECRKGLLRDGEAIMQRAVTLLVNALFYIESAAGKAEGAAMEPGRDTPPADVVAWAQAQPPKRQKLRSRLTNDGYALVRLLGKGIQAEGHSRSGAGVKTHWRRGHWRQQPCGPQRSQVERRWIRPTLVNPDRPHDDMPGHIYAVGTTGDGSTLH